MVFDPCVGRGLTARICEAHGLTVFGIEQNPRRLAVTLRLLEKCMPIRDGIKAERVGSVL